MGTFDDVNKYYKNLFSSEGEILYGNDWSKLKETALYKLIRDPSWEYSFYADLYKSNLIFKIANNNQSYSVPYILPIDPLETKPDESE